MRLNKFISHAGVCARRKADTLILAGKINVNGKPLTMLGYQVHPGDKVTYMGKQLHADKKVYILLNKPRDYITTLQDEQGRKTVMLLVANACQERIYPIGRLDRNTTGLLLFTNDGHLATLLAHPAKEIKKVYQVTLNRPITPTHVAQVQKGVYLADGIMQVEELTVLNQAHTRLALKIHIGRNRIVRRIFEHLGYKVTRLDRTLYANLTKKNLPIGKWRFLTTSELLQLKQAVST